MRELTPLEYLRRAEEADDLMAAYARVDRENLEELTRLRDRLKAVLHRMENNLP